MTILYNLLKQRGNDYSHLELLFRSMTNNYLIRSVDDVTREHANRKQTPYYNTGISVIIPSYNGIERGLEKELAALSTQTLLTNPHNRMEVIVVDDGSTDQTEELVKHISIKYPLKYVKQPNSGPSHARNVGAILAQYPVLLFLDNDTVPLPYTIEEHLRVHATLDNVLLCGARDYVSPHDPYIQITAIKQNPDGILRCTTTSNPKDSISTFTRKEWREPLWKETEYLKKTLPSPSEQLRMYFPTGFAMEHVPHSVCSGNLSVKKESFFSVGGFLDFHGWGIEDIFLGAELMGKGLFIVPSPSALVHHMEHPVSNAFGVFSGNFSREYTQNYHHYLTLLRKTLKPTNNIRTRAHVQLLRTSNKGRWNTYQVEIAT